VSAGGFFTGRAGWFGGSCSPYRDGKRILLIQANRSAYQLVVSTRKTNRRQKSNPLAAVHLPIRGSPTPRFMPRA